jgi:cytochrome c heme-lyase
MRKLSHKLRGERRRVERPRSADRREGRKPRDEGLFIWDLGGRPSRAWTASLHLVFTNYVTYFLLVYLSLLRTMSNSAPNSSPAKCPVDHSSASAQVWTGLAPKLDPSSPSSSSSPPAASPSRANTQCYAYLSTERETSSIPRTANEKWVYPSEAQFYAAMLRKRANPGSASDGLSHGEASAASNAQAASSPSSLDTSAECPVPHAHPQVEVKKPNPFDMKVVVPIHNAVNERTWIEILKWEDHAPRSQNVADPATCPGGLRLVSFKGDATKLTPRARWRSLLGCVTLLISSCFLPNMILY